MQIIHSRDVVAEAPVPSVQRLIETIKEPELRRIVQHISIPRHFTAEAAANRQIADWIFGQLESGGYAVQRQGQYANIIAAPRTVFPEAILVGAHYDSVPACPGADDNGSAVAALLACASACSLWRPQLPIIFVAFNCEEDGLRGSRDFVETFLPHAPFKIRCAHILEMVGYASSEPNTQRVPAGLPIQLGDRGDFLGLLANAASTPHMTSALRRAGAYAPQMPVTALSVAPGLEKFFPVLGRSDHAPFWMKEIPAVMWTDTAEFRNTNYHRATDTAETLNYRFLLAVTQLLTATVIQAAEALNSNTP